MIASIPTPEELLERIKSCREELKALTKLYQMTRHAKLADTERSVRRQRKAVTK